MHVLQVGILKEKWYIEINYILEEQCPTFYTIVTIIVMFSLHNGNSPTRRAIVATLLWESGRLKLTLLKLGLGSPLGLPKLQSSIAGVKTPHIGMFFVSLKSYQSLDVENGLAWAIWTSKT